MANLAETRISPANRSKIANMYIGHSGEIEAYLARRVGPDTAEELTAATFFRACTHINGCDFPDGIDEAMRLREKAWLIKIAHSQFVNDIRNKSRHPTSALDVSTNVGSKDQADDPEKVALRKERIGMIQEALNALPSREQQRVIVLRFVDGYSVEETAGIMGKTEGAIKVLANRAKRHLRNSLEGRVK